MIHLIYPHDSRKIAAPWSIGNRLSKGLSKAGYQVQMHNWTDTKTIYPRVGDILIGHPHPRSGRVFQNSCCFSGWGTVVAMTPWGGLDLTRDMLFRDAKSIDWIAGICGPYWARRPPRGLERKFVPVDMAAEPADFPHVKKRFNHPTMRGFLYLGCTAEAKGTQWLEEVVKYSPDIRWAHIGHGTVEGVESYRYADFSNKQLVEMLGNAYDFVICPGKNDANPTVALESALWGMIPLCRKTAGWECFPILPEDPEDAADVLREYNREVPTTLLRQQKKLRDTVIRDYTWDRFCKSVLSVL
jgi:hypothetical protein